MDIEVLKRAALTSSASRACSRSAPALTSRPAPSSSVDDHASHASLRGVHLDKLALVDLAVVCVENWVLAFCKPADHTHERLVTL